MKKEWLVERQGKQFVLYQGLLSLGHEQGLKSISTELIQIPGEDNNRVAIVRATVIVEKDGVERTFTGIGDAAPNNVAPAMQTCLIRMAETRSKARALRDAVNIGVTAFEELGDEDAVDSAPERGYSSGRGRSAPGPVRAASNGGGRSATPPNTEHRTPNAGRPPEGTPIPAELRNPAAAPSQLPILEQQAEAVRKMCARRGLDAEAVVKEQFGAADLGTLTQAQASDLIRSLNAPVNGKPPVAA